MAWRILPTPVYSTPLHGKLHQKKVPIGCLSHKFNLDAIEKNYSQDPPLPNSIYLKSHTSPPCVVFTFQEYDSEILVCAPVYTKPKMEERGVAGRLSVWRKGNWCGSTTTLTLFFIQNRTLLILYSSEDTYSSLAVGDVVVVNVDRGGPDAVATFTNYNP